MAPLTNQMRPPLTDQMGPQQLLTLPRHLTVKYSNQPNPSFNVRCSTSSPA